jgi:hypothetical protein
VVAALNDGETEYQVEIGDLWNAFDRRVKLTYWAPSNGQTLTVTYTQLEEEGCLNLQAATLHGSRFVHLADSRGPDGVTVNDCREGDLDKCINVPALQDILKVVKRLRPQPDFIIFGGDMSYGKSSETQVEAELDRWVKVVDAIMGPELSDGSDLCDLEDYPLCANNGIYPVFGGHERLMDGPVLLNEPYKAFDAIFFGNSNSNKPDLRPLDRVECDGCQLELGRSVYYFQFGNARFYVLNNDLLDHQLGSTQLGWLKDTLEVSTKDLHFFFHHEPAYGTGGCLSGGGDCVPGKTPKAMDKEKAARNEYMETIAAKATMLFSGHEHHYSRRLIDDAFVDLAINGGPIADDIIGSGESFQEIKTGSCGAPWYPDVIADYSNSTPPSVQKHLHTLTSPWNNTDNVPYHFATVDVSGTNVTVTVAAINNQAASGTQRCVEAIDAYPAPTAGTGLERLGLSDPCFLTNPPERR